MNAIIFNDIVVNKKSLLLLVALVSLFVFLGNEYAALIFLVAPLSLLSILFNSDLKNGTYLFLFTSPIKKSDLILSRLFFPIIFGIIGGMFNFIYLYKKTNIQTNYILLISVSLLILNLLSASFFILIISKFGPDQSKLVFMFLIGAIVILSKIFKVIVNKAYLFLNTTPLKFLVFFFLIISITCITLFIKISINIFEKKEF